MATTQNDLIDPNKPLPGGTPTPPPGATPVPPRELYEPPPLPDAPGSLTPPTTTAPDVQTTLERPSFEAPSGPMPTPETRDVQSNETVAGQLKELLSADSPYLEQGRQEALAQASRRGLQNTSLAAQAGVQGRVAAALPIASQDAAAFGRRAELNQNTVNQFRQSEMDHMDRMIEMAQQGDINAQLQLDQFGFNSKLSAQENIQQLERMAFAGDVDARNRYLDFTYASLMNEIAHGYALDLNDRQFQNSQALLAQEFENTLGLSRFDADQQMARLNQSHQNTLEEIAARADQNQTDYERQFSLQLQGQYLAEVAARQQAGSEEIRIIMQTEGLTAWQQQNAVSQAWRRMQDDISLLQTFYAKSPQWPDNFGVQPGPTGTPTSPPTPGPLIPPPIIPNRIPPITPDERFPTDGREVR